MRPSIIAGAAVGLATGAWMFAEYAVGLHDDPEGAGRWTGFISLIFPVAGAYWLVTRPKFSFWGVAVREGLFFGAFGGLVSGIAIYLYFSVLNPSFRIDGHTVSATTQAVVGFVTSMILGPILTLVVYVFVKGRKRTNGGAF